jgi:hypothetical protein
MDNIGQKGVYVLALVYAVVYCVSGSNNQTVCNPNLYVLRHYVHAVSAFLCTLCAMFIDLLHSTLLAAATNIAHKHKKLHLFEYYD